MTTKMFKEPGLRGFCFTKETPFGTAEAAATTLVDFRDKPTMPKIMERDTDADEYTGSVHRMRHNALKWQLDCVHEQRMLTYMAGLFLALVGGSVSSAAQGGTAAYKHVIEDDDTSPDLLSVTMWEDTPSYGQKEYTGIVCTKVEIEGRRGGFVILRATLRGDGAEASGDALAGIGVANSAEVYLQWGDCDVLIGGTYSEAAGVGSIASGVSIKSQVRSFKVTIDNGGEPVFELGGDAYASSFLKGDLKALEVATIELEIEPSSDDPDLEYDYLLDETENVIEVKITGASMGGSEAAYYYTVDLMFPVTRSDDASIGADGALEVGTHKFVAIKDDSENGYPIYQAQVTNKTTAYLG